MEKRQVMIGGEMNAIVAYDDSFRLILSRDDLNEYHKGFVNWHKQSAIEISVITEGAVNVYVLEREQTVKEGEGFFILPGYLHSIQPAAGYEASKYFTLIFYPEILCGVSGSYYEKAYYRPVADCNTPLFLFRERETWAAELLESSDLSVTEIAEAAGFCDVSYFIRVFRQKTGITPKVFAKKRR